MPSTHRSASSPSVTARANPSPTSASSSRHASSTRALIATAARWPAWKPQQRRGPAPGEHRHGLGLCEVCEGAQRSVCAGGAGPASWCWTVAGSRCCSAQGVTAQRFKSIISAIGQLQPHKLRNFPVNNRYKQKY